jgi:DNA-binding CsgD family transcriptional regulator
VQVRPDQPAAPGLVGRDAALTRIDEALARGGAGGVVLQLAGDAGIGKTRLVEALTERARGLGRTVLVGRAQPQDAALPLGPLLDAVRGDRRARPDSEPPEDPLAARFPEWLLPELAGAEPPDRGALFEAATRYMTWLARRGGVVLVLEDLHWADPSTHELTGHLARTTTEAPVLIVLTYRLDEPDADGLDRMRAALRRARIGGEIELGPLGPDAVAELLDGLTSGRIKESLRTQIEARAGGNPFVLEELVRDACEGCLEPDGPLPWAVRDMLLQRVRRLDEADQELVRWAAILGDRVDLELLRVSAGLGLPDLLGGIERLHAAGLVVDDPERPTERVAFRHSLTREAVVHETLAVDRRLRHDRVRAAAEELVASGHPVPFAEIAGHALAAGDRRAGFEYSRRAARRSLELAGYDEAQHHFERALELWEPSLGLEAYADTLYEYGPLLARVVHDTRSLSVLREARAALLRLGDPVRAAVVLAAAAEARREMGEADTAFEQLRQAADELGEDGPAWARLPVAAAYAKALMLRGEAAEATRIAEEALAMVPADAGREALMEQVQLLNTLGSALWTNDAARGRAALEESLAIAERIGDPAGACRGCINLATFLWWRDAAWDEAERAVDRGLQLAREHGLFFAYVWLLVFQAELAAERGDWRNAERTLDEARLVMGRRDPQADLVSNLENAQAWVAIVRGQFDGLEERLAELVVGAQSLDHRGLVGGGVLGIAIVRLARGDHDGAREILTAHLDAPMQSRMDDTSHCLAGLEAAAIAGDPSDAADLLSQDIPWSLPELSDVARAFAESAAGGPSDPSAFERAARRLDGGPRWRAACLRLFASRALARTPECRDEAVRLAQGAEAAFASMEVDPWAELARDTLRALGVRAPSRRAGGAGPLTAREVEVLALVAEGASNREIAERLVISEPTAARHVANIFAKLGARTRAQAVGLAAEQGLLDAAAVR